MKIARQAIRDILVIEPTKFFDERGFFSEVFNNREFANAGLLFNWVQDNRAMSYKKGTLRGLHFQAPPYAQTKLITVIKGSIFDVAVDVRVGSPTFAHWVSVIVSASTQNQVLIPKGFAHGYLTLEPETEVLYKVDEHYAPKSNAGVIWNDTDLSIDWPLDGISPMLSDNDRNLPKLSELTVKFSFI